MQSAMIAPVKGFVSAGPQMAMRLRGYISSEQPQAAATITRSADWPQTGTVAGMNSEAAEQRRLKEISEIACLFDLETVRAAMHGPNACTAQEMAYRALKKMSEEGKRLGVDSLAAIEAQAVADVNAWDELMRDIR